MSLWEIAASVVSVWHLLLDLTPEDTCNNHSLLSSDCSVCLLTLLEQNLAGLHLFHHTGFMPSIHTDCKDASHLGFNPEKNLSMSKTLKMLGTAPNLITLKTELIPSI